VLGHPTVRLEPLAGVVGGQLLPHRYSLAPVLWALAWVVFFRMRTAFPHVAQTPKRWPKNLGIVLMRMSSALWLEPVQRVMVASLREFGSALVVEQNADARGLRI